jgi:hypothetical protein
MACITATNAFWHSGVQNSLNLSFFILSPEDAKVASPQGQTLVPIKCFGCRIRVQGLVNPQPEMLTRATSTRTVACLALLGFWFYQRHDGDPTDCMYCTSAPVHTGCIRLLSKRVELSSWT